MMVTHKRWLVRFGIAVAILVAFVAGFSLRSGAPEHGEQVAGGEQSVWTCSMHPQIRLPEAGSCPICGMDLIPVASSGSRTDGPRSLTLSPHAQAIAEIHTTRVERRAVQTTLRTVGKLEADESRIREISAWVPGRIDRLYIDYTGVTVQAGTKLFDLYSPALYSAQEELVQAIRAADNLSRSGLESTRGSATRTVTAAREKLRLWGLSAEQIERVEERGKPSEHVTIHAPISGTVLHKDALEGSYVETGTHVYTIADLSVLWLKLDVYESDIAWVALGHTVRFTTDTFAGEQFEGVISFIDPVLDQRSRSVKVRVNVRNDDGRLKPGMFARAVVHADVRGGDDSLPIVIPKSAPLVTGVRAIVYVADPHNPGQYHGREVVLGPESDEYVVVLDGLAVGEMVVSNGSFKIDSALQIQAKQSMMNPAGGAPPPVHDHGGDRREQAATSGQPAQAMAGVPHEFHLQLDGALDLYFDVSAALSHDDVDTAKDAARRLPAALARPDDALLPADARTRWASARSALDVSAKAIASSADIATARSAFYDLSVNMINVVRAFGASGTRPVLVYHCPMAKDGDGADWLQFKSGTENPYYGSQMFRCGSETETLVPQAGNGSEHDHN